MKNRIRAAAIIVKDNKILLVRRIHPTANVTWWVPPGGGIEDIDTSLLDCVARETMEETGLRVSVAPQPRFIREYADVEHDTVNIEIFFDATIIDGTLTAESRNRETRHAV
jgi:8-oxo-dGTP pyrophosphatase MutT (NUDIX family)